MLEAIFTMCLGDQLTIIVYMETINFSNLIKLNFFQENLGKDWKNILKLAFYQKTFPTDSELKGSADQRDDDLVLF